MLVQQMFLKVYQPAINYYTFRIYCQGTIPGKCQELVNFELNMQVAHVVLK